VENRWIKEGETRVIHNFLSGFWGGVSLSTICKPVIHSRIFSGSGKGCHAPPAEAPEDGKVGVVTRTVGCAVLPTEAPEDGKAGAAGRTEGGVGAGRLCRPAPEERAGGGGGGGGFLIPE